MSVIGSKTEDPSYELLKNNLKQLRYLGERLSKFTSKIPHEAHTWTLLKLVFLKLYIETVYTPIISKRYKRMFYVDLFAGTGVNMYRVNDRQVYLPGSPVIAWTYAKRQFTKLFLVEYNSEAAKSLEQVMEIISPRGKFEVYREKAENAYTKILWEISRRGDHFLCFIDPTGYSGVTWDMLRKLIGHKIRGDFLILLQAGFMAMHIKKHGKTDTLTRFFGDDNWYDEIQKLKSELGNLRHAIIQYFEDRIREIKGRERIIETINVKKDSQTEHYYLIFITNKTSTGNPWMEKVQNLKMLIEESPQKVDTAIQDVLGIAKPILDFL